MRLYLTSEPTNASPRRMPFSGLRERAWRLHRLWSNCEDRLQGTRERPRRPSVQPRPADSVKCPTWFGDHRRPRAVDLTLRVQANEPVHDLVDRLVLTVNRQKRGCTGTFP